MDEHNISTSRRNFGKFEAALGICVSKEIEEQLFRRSLFVSGAGIHFQVRPYVAANAHDAFEATPRLQPNRRTRQSREIDIGPAILMRDRQPLRPRNQAQLEGSRSEERRVGKECRSRWSTDHYRG